jgi:hypothetical protein
MADPHPHSHHPIPRRPSPSSPVLEYAPSTQELAEQLTMIQGQLSRIDGMQKADHTLLASVNEAVGSSPDAATGAEGRGMRKQLAEVATNVTEMRREWAELKVDAKGGGHESMMKVGKGSTAGTVGSIVAGFMATAIAVVEILKAAGVLK